MRVNITKLKAAMAEAGFVTSEGSEFTAADQSLYLDFALRIKGTDGTKALYGLAYPEGWLLELSDEGEATEELEVPQTAAADVNVVDADDAEVEDEAGDEDGESEGGDQPQDSASEDQQESQEDQSQDESTGEGEQQESQEGEGQQESQEGADGADDSAA